MLPLFLPPVTYVSRLPDADFRSLEKWCELAKIRCAASGNWVVRPNIAVTPGDNWQVLVEAAYPGRAIIRVPGSSAMLLARLAKAVLLVMAYHLNDPAARQSVKGASWTRVVAPPGRPRQVLAMSGTERQRKYRQRVTVAT